MLFIFDTLCLSFPIVVSLHYLDFIKLLCFLTCFDKSKVLYVFVIMLDLTKIWNDFMIGYPIEGLWWIEYIELYFYFREFMSCFQMKICWIFGRFSKVRTILLACCHTGLGIHFSNGFWYQCMPYGFLRGVSRNRDSLKDTRWLLCARPLGRCIT